MFNRCRRREGDKTVTIVYDGDGNRAKKIVTTSTNTVTTRFLVDTVNLSGYAQVLEEITTDTANPQLAAPHVTRTYRYGHDLIGQQYDPDLGLSFLRVRYQNTQIRLRCVDVRVRRFLVKWFSCSHAMFGHWLANLFAVHPASF